MVWRKFVKMLKSDWSIRDPSGALWPWTKVFFCTGVKIFGRVKAWFPDGFPQTLKVWNVCYVNPSGNQTITRLIANGKRGFKKCCSGRKKAVFLYVFQSLIIKAKYFSSVGCWTGFLAGYHGNFGRVLDRFLPGIIHWDWSLAQGRDGCAPWSHSRCFQWCLYCLPLALFFYPVTYLFIFFLVSWIDPCSLLWVQEVIDMLGQEGCSCRITRITPGKRTHFGSTGSCISMERNRNRLVFVWKTVMKGYFLTITR